MGMCEARAPLEILPEGWVTGTLSYQEFSWKKLQFSSTCTILAMGIFLPHCYAILKPKLSHPSLLSLLVHVGYRTIKRLSGNAASTA